MKSVNYVLGCLLAFSLGSFALKAEEEPKVKLNFAGLDLATVAHQVEKITKRSFLFDDTQLRTKHVTLQSDTPIGATELYRVFQAVCQMNGLVLIPVENAGIKLEKIVPSMGAFKEPGDHPVLVRGDELPNGDALISYLVKLKFSSPQYVIAAITPVLSQNGSIIQVPNTDLLIVSDVASTVKRTEKLLDMLDVPAESIKTLTYPLRNIGVEKASALLTEYLQATGRAKGGESAPQHLAVIKDDRLNTLHLLGAPAEIEQAASFLKEIDVDSPSARRTVRYYRLKNVPVKDVVDHVSRLLELALAARQTEQRPQTSSANAVTPPPPVPLPRDPIGTPPVGQNTLPAPLIQKSPDAKRNSTEIIAVEGLNTLVVVGDELTHQEVESILENLDRRKGQVLIEAAIVQVTGDESLNLGAEFLSINNVAGPNHFADAGTGFGLGAQSERTVAAPGTPATGTGAGAGGTLLNNAVNAVRGFPTQTVIGSVAGSAFRYVGQDKFQAILTALAGKSNISIVSQPLLLVNDNEEGSFSTKVSEPTVTTSQGTATTNTSFSGFADATTSLKITPHVSAGGFLNLEIVQTVEEFTGAAAGAGIPPPKVSNNATTKVSIPDRQTIVIGGFTRDSATETKSGIPGLMNVPGLGHLFSKTDKKKTISRLYLFIHPKILSTVSFDDLEHESERKKDDVERLSGKSDVKKAIRERIGRTGDETNAEIVPLDRESKKSERIPLKETQDSK